MDAADDLLHTKLVPHRITPRKTTYLGCSGTTSGCLRTPALRTSGSTMSRQMASPTRPPPPPPGISLSLDASRWQQQRNDENIRERERFSDHNEGSQDVTSNIWAKIRHFSGLSATQRCRNPSASTTASVAASVSLPLPAACGTASRTLRRGRSSIDKGGSLLMQRHRQAAMSSKTSLTDRTNCGRVEEMLTSGTRRSSKGSGKGRKGSGRWGGFAGWFV